ncbi:MAG: tRNA (adenosine(37)-N6)-threonylcarbamoyltransferase complex transferase subunit TsaD [Thermaerobacter sp.]|jgi:N6-L-threonylcarbamoyladenine synthase|nr:tRNA (adenosine(37)-N6)-threonylcarbamoyltransferase complex transferase subunit TsaD [Thermaerobacter sp.]
MPEGPTGAHLTLGIETSCDETAAAVVADGQRVLADVVASQAELFRRFGGVVPEIASRHHLELLLPAVTAALERSGVRLEAVDAVAVTQGPGLVGALLVGVCTAKTLAWALDVPLVGVHHVLAHIYANFLPEAPALPAVCLVVSGGHTDLVVLDAAERLTVLGRTRDDAAGEAFDKLAREMGLGYPGGAALERLARGGDPAAVPLPRAWLGQDSADFSFSGLKTAALTALRRGAPSADLAAGFQAAAVEVLVEKTVRAARRLGVGQVLLAGGVSANGALREAMARAAAREGLGLSFPPVRLCTDNAAMVACAGYRRLERGERAGWDLNAVADLELT